MERSSHFTTLVVLSIFVLACAGFEYPFLSDEPEKNVQPRPKCGQCNESSCPRLQYCVAVVVKDHCGCCNICSTDLYQGKMRQDSPAVEDSPCSSVVCPKYKVCMENMQGLPLCSCPSIYSCRRKKKEVCGTDNLTYHSRCHLRIAACNMGKRIKVLHKAPCSPDELATSAQGLPKKRKMQNKRKRRRKNKNKAGKNNKITDSKKKDRQRGVGTDLSSNKRGERKSRRRQKRRNSRRKRMQYKSRRVSRKYQLLPYRF